MKHSVFVRYSLRIQRRLQRLIGTYLGAGKLERRIYITRKEDESGLQVGMHDPEAVQDWLQTKNKRVPEFGLCVTSTTATRSLLLLHRHFSFQVIVVGTEVSLNQKTTHGQHCLATDEQYSGHAVEERAGSRSP